MARARQLGVGSYQLAVRERGGGRLVGVLQHSRLQFSRALDDMSTLTAVVHPVDEYTVRPGQFVDALGQLEEWEHELHVYRNGEREPVWLGPVTAPPAYVEGEAAVSGKDLFAWFERRLQPLDREMVGTDLSVIFRRLVDDVLAVENSMGVKVRSTPSGLRGDRTIVAASYQRSADLLRDLGRVGVDFTVVGRTLLAGGIEVPTPDLPTLVDEVLLDPSVQRVPSVSRVVVIGGTTRSGVPPVGIAETENAAIGLVEVTASEPLALDQASADAAAQSRLDFFASGASLVSATLDPRAPVDFSTLVPGARCHVQLLRLAKQVDTVMRLTSVDVSHEVSDGGETEVVRVTFGPLGSVAEGGSVAGVGGGVLVDDADVLVDDAEVLVDSP